MTVRGAWRWLVAGGVATVDLAAKRWALHALAPLGAHASGIVHLGLVRNRGIAWSIGATHPLVAGVAAAVAVAAVAFWLSRSTDWLLCLGLAMVLGGGVGNLVDRLQHGAVTDWIHISGYPTTFNLADLAIRSGAVVVVVAAWRGGRLQRLAIDDVARMQSGHADVDAQVVIFARVDTAAATSRTGEYPPRRRPRCRQHTLP